MHYCLWDIPALALLIASAVILAVNKNRRKKERQELEDELSAKMAVYASGEKS